MKISLPLQSFSKSVRVASKISNEKSPSPILSNLRLVAAGDTLTITATNLSTDLTITIPAEIEDAGRVVVPAKQLSDWLEKVSGETVKAAIKDSKLKLSCGRSTLTLSTIPPEEFPDVDCLSVFDLTVISKDEFSEAIERTIHAISTDINLVTSNLCFKFLDSEHLEIIGCDGIRLAIYNVTCSIQKPISYILNKDACRYILEAIKLETGNLTLRGCGNKFLVSGQTIQLATLRTEGEYINYNQILDNLVEKTHFTIDTTEFKRSVNIVAVASSDNNEFIDLVTSQSLLNICTSKRVIANSIGDSETDTEITDQEGFLVITLNSNYLLESINAIKSPTIRISTCLLGEAPMFMLTEQEYGKIRCLLAPYAVPE